MAHTMNHPSNLGSIRQGEGLVESSESETPNGLLLVSGSSDPAPDPFDRNRFLHIEPFSSPLLSQTFFQKPPQGPSVG
jgi:hypothetical protein